ncbi:hypothetical protein ACFSC6_15320 [Rufibacter sediminis]|uniref:Lipocalin-like domain-containing protein n=1 Tax=Rufibacter sediminis TaxID=2762756 RepID=A0ABR6VW52_9BACT|nr:hypothetical protein [Rufibacter sediminis]MBC3541405.1 hypothetical protein [Rufibacter sediminis]
MRIYVLLLLATFFVIGCKVEEVEPAPELPKTVEELIQGDWFIVNEKYEHYNSSNQKIHEGGGITNHGEAFITNRHFKQNHSTGTLNSGFYSISDIAGAKYIYIDHEEDASSSTFLLHIVNETEMVWMKESYNQHYYNGSGMVPSAKTLFYITFKRK